MGAVTFEKRLASLLGPEKVDSVPGFTYIVYGSFSASLPSSYSFQYDCLSSCGAGLWARGRGDLDLDLDLGIGDVGSLVSGVDARRCARMLLYSRNKGSKSRRVKLFGLFRTSCSNRSPRVRDPVHF